MTIRELLWRLVRGSKTQVKAQTDVALEISRQRMEQAVRRLGLETEKDKTDETKRMS